MCQALYSMCVELCFPHSHCVKTPTRCLIGTWRKKAMCVCERSPCTPAQPYLKVNMKENYCFLFQFHLMICLRVNLSHASLEIDLHYGSRFFTHHNVKLKWPKIRTQLSSRYDFVVTEICKMSVTCVKFTLLSSKPPKTSCG